MEARGLGPAVRLPLGASSILVLPILQIRALARSPPAASFDILAGFACVRRGCGGGGLYFSTKSNAKHVILVQLPSFRI